MRQVSETNAAVPTAQGAAKPESAMDWDVVTSPLVKIPAFIPATDEELEDVDGFEELIDRRLMRQVLTEEDDQILNGTGSTELTGLYNTTGVQTQAIGADTIEDAIFEAAHKVRINGLTEPNACIISATDYRTIRLRKDANDQYIWGPPSLPPPRYMWEMLLVISTAVVAGQPIVGDFSFAHISRKTSGHLKVSKEHDDYFVKNKVAIVAEVRTSLEVYRPSAFAYVTA
jgi:HK97 family phage major capsid protein